MEKSGEYWGEMSPWTETDADSGIAAVERAEITKLRPLNTDLNKTNNQFERSDVNTDYLDIRVSDIPIGNPVMLHSIKLLQFIRQLSSDSLLSRESLPQLMPSKPLPDVVIPRKFNINGLAVKQLVRRALIVIIYHYGYDTTTESIIDILVDITCEYLREMCLKLRQMSDTIELRSNNDFVDVVDRVFHDMNVNSFESIRQYDLDLRLYNQNLMREALRKIGINESIKCSEFGLKLSDKSPLRIASLSEDSDAVNISVNPSIILNKSDDIQENIDEIVSGLSPNKINTKIDSNNSLI